MSLNKLASSRAPFGCADDFASPNADSDPPGAIIPPPSGIEKVVAGTDRNWNPCGQAVSALHVPSDIRRRPSAGQFR